MVLFSQKNSRYKYFFLKNRLQADRIILAPTIRAASVDPNVHHVHAHAYTWTASFLA